MPANWKARQWPQNWESSAFIPIPKKGNTKECSYCHTIALISHASKIMSQILQARLLKYVNRELSNVQCGSKRGWWTRENCMKVVRIKDRTTGWFKIGKEVCLAAYCHPAYLTSMQSTSCGMLGWMKLILDQDFPEKYQ